MDEPVRFWSYVGSPDQPLASVLEEASGRMTVLEPGWWIRGVAVERKDLLDSWEAKIFYSQAVPPKYLPFAASREAAP